MADARFFKNVSERNVRPVFSPIEVRGDVFRVLAVAIMDNVKSGIALPEATLQNILARYARHFPDAKKNHNQLPLEPETLGCLAFVLRQLAMDEAFANPTQYQELFSGLSRGLTKDHLRQIDTPVHSSVLAAAARALNITITLSIETPTENLRALKQLNKADCSSSYNVTLQVQENKYFPCVRNHGYFAAIGQLPIEAPKPVMPTSTDTLAETLDEIAHSNGVMWQKYIEYRNRLTSTASASELTSYDLALLYADQRFLPDEDSLQLFSRLEEQRTSPIVRRSPESLEQKGIQSLLKAFACGLSTGRINEDELLDAMEQPSYRRTARVS